MCDDDEDEDLTDFDSGPFCPHWGDPSDCTEMCVCGHPCKEHTPEPDPDSLGDIWSCDNENCNCRDFQDPPDEVTDGRLQH